MPLGSSKATLNTTLLVDLGHAARVAPITTWNHAPEASEYCRIDVYWIRDPSLRAGRVAIDLLAHVASASTTDSEHENVVSPSPRGFKYVDLCKPT